MLARTWRGATRAADADSYLDALHRTGLPGYQATPGNRGVLALRRVDDGRAEWLLVTLWDSVDGVRVFAGDDVTAARFYPAVDDVLTERDERAVHFEAVHVALDPALAGGATARQIALAQLTAAYAGPAWHGSSVRGALRGLPRDLPDWSSGPGRPTVRELVLHLAYTRHRVAGRLLRLAQGPTPPRPARFPRRLARSWWPAADPAVRWRDELGLLHMMHGRVLAAARSAGGTDVPAALVAGLALHDAYHAGQIRLIRRLRGGRSTARAR